jgi:hypothetical protein
LRDSNYGNRSYSNRTHENNNFEKLAFLVKVNGRSICRRYENLQKLVSYVTLNHAFH